MNYLIVIFAAIGFLSVILVLYIPLRYTYERLTQDIPSLERNVSYLKENQKNMEKDFQRLRDECHAQSEWIKRLEDGIQEMIEKEKTSGD